MKKTYEITHSETDYVYTEIEALPENAEFVANGWQFIYNDNADFVAKFPNELLFDSSAGLNVTKVIRGIADAYYRHNGRKFAVINWEGKPCYVSNSMANEGIFIHLPTPPAPADEATPRRQFVAHKWAFSTQTVNAPENIELAQALADLVKTKKGNAPHYRYYAKYFTPAEKQEMIALLQAGIEFVEIAE